MASIKRCCICGNIIIGDGNDPKPLNLDNDKVCCDYCYATKVISYALKKIRGREFDISANIQEDADGKLYIKKIYLIEPVEEVDNN